MAATKRPLVMGSLFVSAALVLISAFGAWNVLRPLPAITAEVTPQRQLAARISVLNWPKNGSAAVGAKGFGVLGVNGSDQPRPTASIAKTITSLAVLERKPLKPNEQGTTFKIGAADVALYHDYEARGGFVVPVTAGEQISQYQALQALMLPSANNIADSLAVWVFGSYDNYAAYANNMVKQLGMDSTTIAGDASGLSPLTTSTPSDLVKLGQAALDNPVLSKIAAQPSAELPVVGTVYNVNWLLGQDGVIGIKSGSTDEAGGCLLAAANIEVAPGQTVKAITAVMGETTRNAAMAASLVLIKSIKANFSYVPFVTAGQKVATYRLPWGKTVAAVSKADISLAIWNDLPVSVTPKLNNHRGSVLKGEKLGTITVVSGTQSAATDLVASEDVAGPSLWWRATRRP